MIRIGRNGYEPIVYYQNGIDLVKQSARICLHIYISETGEPKEFSRARARVQARNLKFDELEPEFKLGFDFESSPSPSLDSSFIINRARARVSARWLGFLLFIDH